MEYGATKESLKQHEIPDWFNDAKFGIFIHWGLFSVPAFAVTGLDLNESMKKGIEEHFKNNPYAEWYLNSLRIPGSPTQKYHEENYGEDFSYDDFAPIFNEELKKWNPNLMVDLFKKAGAKYVVLVTKHHDGFLLWPSKTPNPRKKNYHTSRNIVKELTNTVKNEGLKMGFYYSGALDWSFQPEPIKDAKTFVINGPSEREYTKYANTHWYELINDYDPLILWNDIGYPPNTNVYEIFAYFYNKTPQGIINDRWRQSHKSEFKHPKVRFWDFVTPEYETMPKITNYKWETTRGIGYSFGYNKMETEEDYLNSEDIIRMLVEVVSKNGNLLLNVGPMPDGTIPEPQRIALLGLGKWLEINGEAIYGTKPWIIPEGIINGKKVICFTQKENSLFLHLMKEPKEEELLIESINLSKHSKVTILGNENEILWNNQEKGVSLQIPKDLKKTPVVVFKITPLPEYMDEVKKN